VLWGGSEKTLDKPLDLSDETFSEVVSKYPFVVIDCWAPWCGPCMIVSPIIEELAKDYAGKIVFGRLNVDKNQRVPLQYGIMSIPTLLVFKNGKLVDRIVGAMPKSMLKQRITRHL
ncbi:MAG: thioredoxin, partial [Candidatus Freyarchaeota archaeon]